MKMKVTEQLATMTVGMTKRSAKPTTRKVVDKETKRPRRRQVVKETSSVVTINAMKRISGRPTKAA